MVLFLLEHPLDDSVFSKDSPSADSGVYRLVVMREIDAEARSYGYGWGFPYSGE